MTPSKRYLLAVVLSFMGTSFLANAPEVKADGYADCTLTYSFGAEGDGGRWVTVWGRVLNTGGPPEGTWVHIYDDSGRGEAYASGFGDAENLYTAFFPNGTHRARIDGQVTFGGGYTCYCSDYLDFTVNVQ